MFDFSDDVYKKAREYLVGLAMQIFVVGSTFIFPYWLALPIVLFYIFLFVLGIATIGMILTNVKNHPEEFTTVSELSSMYEVGIKSAVSTTIFFMMVMNGYVYTGFTLIVLLAVTSVFNRFTLIKANKVARENIENVEKYLS